MKYIVLESMSVFLVRKEMQREPKVNPYNWALVPFVVKRDCYYGKNDLVSLDDKLYLEVGINKDLNLDTAGRFYLFRLPVNSNNYRYLLIHRDKVLVRNDVRTL
jgi:hypothetical protein